MEIERAARGLHGDRKNMREEYTSRRRSRESISVSYTPFARFSNHSRGFRMERRIDIHSRNGSRGAATKDPSGNFGTSRARLREGVASRYRFTTRYPRAAHVTPTSFAVSERGEIRSVLNVPRARARAQMSKINDRDVKHICQRHVSKRDEKIVR